MTTLIGESNQQNRLTTHETERRLIVRAPASSANLGPGFDALGLALDLWNELEITLDGEPGAVTIEGRDADLLRGGDGEERENLVLRAMRLVAEDHGRTLPPCALTLRNGVPVARGLGSSAAALVAGVVAADRLLGLGLSRAELYSHVWRMEGHGDNVGAALYGGAILAVPGVPEAVRLWRGDRAWAAIPHGQLARVSSNGAGTGSLPSMDVPDGTGHGLAGGLTVAAFIPELTGATWAARAALPERIPHPDAAHNVATASALSLGLLLGDRELIAAGMRDRLHEPYRARLFPHLLPLTEAARAAGAVGACLSGAGPTILALVDETVVNDVITAMADEARALGLQGEATVLAPTTQGAHFVETMFANDVE